MARTQSESQEHQKLIAMMVRHFENQGYREIRADIQGKSQPATIQGAKRNHIPDLTARKNGKIVILEAETAGTVSDDHTISQWTLFANAASKSGGEFHVVVPKGAREAAEKRASSLGIRINSIWTPS
ncbi:MAG: hypothetical protein JRH18_23950 [Deltaproteobacteria bacterium]|nr:hypothetical protein [Deltaproteobacteria bacterium]MBW2154701.1 hypothetical protein [Deltaproteobacteria bacterium]